jgi:hypothetical protein
MPACGSPKLIAACHVFHRLLLPRHPPCALSSLTTKFTRHTGITCSSLVRQFPIFIFHCRPESRMIVCFQTTIPNRGICFSALLSNRGITNHSIKAKSSNTPRKFYGPKNSAHHALKRLYAFRIPADISFSLGTHKNLQPCRLPNLFSCQISSSPAFTGCPPKQV